MPVEIERKFLLGAAPDWSHPALRDAAVIEYEQIYLKVDGPDEVRIRRSIKDARTAYHLARLHRLSDGIREVEERELDGEEYETLRRDRDPNREIIAKVRHCFHWREHFFELDDIRRPTSRACLLLELQVDSLEESFSLPDFLVIDREVTTDVSFSNAMIALG